MQLLTRPIAEWFSRTPWVLLLIIGAGVVAACWDRSWGFAGLLEVAVIFVALVLLPRHLRRHYRPLFQDPRRLGWMAAGLLVLAVPTIFGANPGPRHAVATLMLMCYALPMLRSGPRSGWMAFLFLLLGVIFYLLPFAVFQVEQAHPTDEIWVAAFQTNTREAMEYLHHPSAYLSVAVMGVVAVLLVKAGLGLRSGQAHPWRVALLVGLFYVQVATGLPGHLVVLYHHYQTIFRSWREMAEDRAKGLAGVQFTAEPGSPGPRRILLILGESTTRRHLSLYGYGRPTTPNLEALHKEGGLTVFEDVISPHTLTMPSLEKVLTTSNNQRPIPYVNSISIIDVFKRAGFHTFWVSNQNKAGAWDDQVSVMANAAGAQYFPDGQVGTTLDAAPDGVILPIFSEFARATTGRTLAICHLMGAHEDYRRRVPWDFQLKTLAQHPELGTYDMAIRYGDEVVASLFRKAQEAGFDTVVYLPDHGEVPHDRIRHNPALYTPEMVEIPFLVWLSPGLRKFNPALARRVEAARSLPWMSDDLIHVLIDLAGLKCSLYDPTRSVLDPNFRKRPRRVIDGTILYRPSDKPHPDERS